MLTRRYLAEVQRILDRITEVELERIEDAGARIADRVGDGGAIFVFGAGHTSMVAQEVFYRAGGLAIVNPLFGPGLMLDQRPVTLTTQVERLEGLGRILVRAHDVGPQDALIVASVSGRNSVPVEVALEGKTVGALVVALTSLAYSKSVVSRHRSGKRLFEVADIVLDLGAPPGDATLPVEGLEAKVGPVSTIAGLVIVNLLILRVIERLIEKGIRPPVLASANLDWGDDHNHKLLESYRSRIRYM